MAVRKSINIAGSGPTIEASIHEAIDRAYTTLEGITRFEVTKISGDLTDSGPVFDVDERMRAAGAGIGAFCCPTGVGTPLADGKEVRTIDGRDYVLEYPIRGDVALIGAHIGDRAGNLVYRKTARNFGPVMATAAGLTIAEVSRVVDIGDIDPETVVTPGIYVDRILEVST